MRTIIDRLRSHRLLIDACTRGDGRALREFSVRFRGAVYDGAVRAIGNRLAICGTADDLTNEFFVRLLKDPKKILRGYGGRSDLSPWLTAVALRQCSMILRSHAWRWPGTGPVFYSRNLDKLPAPVHQTPHAPDLVSQLLEQLDGPSRAIIESRFGLGRYKQPLSVEQIANRIGCSRRTVYRRFHESLRLLRTLARTAKEKLDE